MNAPSMVAAATVISYLALPPLPRLVKEREGRGRRRRCCTCTGPGRAARLGGWVPPAGYNHI